MLQIARHLTDAPDGVLNGLRFLICDRDRKWIWLQRWNGVSPRAVLHAADFPGLDAVRTRWSEVDVEQWAFLDALTDERLVAVVRYVNLKGETWQYPLWRQMCHVV